MRLAGFDIWSDNDMTDDEFDEMEEYLRARRTKEQEDYIDTEIIKEEVIGEGYLLEE